MTNRTSTQAVVIKEPQNKFHTFSGSIGDVILIFEFLMLKDTLFIFVTDQKCEFKNLSMAIETRFANMPLSTTLIGDYPQSPINGIAARLSKKFKKVVYLSVNTNRDMQLLVSIEKALYDELIEILKVD